MSGWNQHSDIESPVLSDATPVVVGGIGGSGTRAIAQLLIEIGFDMGSDLNDSLDDLGFTALFKRSALWPLESHYDALREALAVYLTSRGFPTPYGISEIDHKCRAEQLIARIEAEGPWRECGKIRDRLTKLTAIPDRQAHWGWKEPNSLVVLPYLLTALPFLKYIHVLRDGRDMAYSANKNQLQLWGSTLLGRRVNERSAQDALDYWCASHWRLLDLRRQNPQRILLIKLESCIEDTSSTLDLIFDFLGTVPKAATGKVARIFHKPQSLNRYRDQPILSLSNEQTQLFKILGYPDI